MLKGLTQSFIYIVSTEAEQLWLSPLATTPLSIQSVLSA